MAINLKTLKSSKSTLPPRVLIHAVEGVGKTSLAAEWPAPVYLPTPGEATPDGIEIPAFDPVTSWAEVVENMGQLCNDEHDFKTLIIDTADGLEPLIWRETAAQNKWESIETPGYGKGYLAADTVWRRLLQGCDYLRTHRGMTTILLAHSDRVSHEEPGVQPYKRYDLRLQKRAQAILCDWSDYIFFVNSKVEIATVDAGFNKKSTHAKGGGTRWIYTDARPAFVAKNRGADMPDQVMYRRGSGFASLAPHMGAVTIAAMNAVAAGPAEPVEADSEAA